MDSFIKKIFDENVDEIVHLQFQKFSRGEFQNRAMIKAKNSKGKFSLTTSAEYANELVSLMAQKLGEDKTQVKGVVVSTQDLDREFEFQNKKQFMGIKQYILDKEMSGKEILELQEKLPKAFFGLSFKVGEEELKIKPKAPKSAKPSTKDKSERPKIDFCKLKTKDESIIDKFIFDEEAKEFKNIEIAHTFLINEIVMPEGEKDFSKIRELAKKKGKIIRELIINENDPISKEKEFIV